MLHDVETITVTVKPKKIFSQIDETIERNERLSSFKTALRVFNTVVPLIKPIKNRIMLFMILSLAGKLVGFFREASIAKSFGTSLVYDQFLLASTLPIALTTILAYVINWIYLPLYTEIRSNRGIIYANRYIYDCAKKGIALWLAILTGIAIAGILDNIFPIFFMEISVLKSALLPFEILMLMVPIQVANSYISIILLVNNRNWAVLFGPLLGSICTILILNSGSIKTATNLSVVYVLAQVVCLSCILLVQRLVEVEDDRSFVSQKINITINNVVMSAFIYVILIEVSPQIGLSIDRIFVLKNYPTSGILAALTYAQTILGFFTSIGIMMAMQMFFPFIAKRVADSEKRLFSHDEKTKIVAGIGFMILLSIYSACNAEKIVYVVFFGGKFSAISVEKVASYFSWLTPLLFLDVIYSFLASYLFSKNEISKVLKASSILLMTKLVVIAIAVGVNGVNFIYYVLIGSIISSIFRIGAIVLMDSELKAFSRSKEFLKRFSIVITLIVLIILIYAYIRPHSQNDINELQKTTKLIIIAKELVTFFAITVVYLLSYFVSVKALVNRSV